MNAVKKWLEDHKISAHTIVLAWGTLVTLYSTNTPFHNFVWGLYAKTPAAFHEVVAGLVIPVFMLYNSKKENT